MVTWSDGFRAYAQNKVFEVSTGLKLRSILFGHFVDNYNVTYVWQKFFLGSPPLFAPKVSWMFFKNLFVGENMRFSFEVETANDVAAIILKEN